MELQDGNLSSLVTSGRFNEQLANSLFHHGLQALDYISYQDLIHRDVKPDNFMFKELRGQYDFLLGDFGLSNRTTVAHTFAGSPLYMAPEMFQKQCQQTHKIDMWAFLVTMGWVLNVGRLRALDKAKTIEEIHLEVLTESRNWPLSDIQEMAIYDPAKRASAAQMLIKCFNGQGLSTPRNKVPTLVGNPLNTAATVKTSAPAVIAQITTATNVLRNVHKIGKVHRTGRVLGPAPQTQKARALRSGRHQTNEPGPEEDSKL